MCVKSRPCGRSTDTFTIIVFIIISMPKICREKSSANLLWSGSGNPDVSTYEFSSLLCLLGCKFSSVALQRGIQRWNKYSFKWTCLIKSHILHESDNLCRISTMFEDLILALNNGCLHRMFTLSMRYSHHRICNCIRKKNLWTIVISM